MITIAWYILKVVICSGILCGYYFLALRNKVFHRWNRFYLLATIVISLVVPVMKINVFSSGEDNGTVVRMLQTISYGDETVIEMSKHNSFQFTTETASEAAYLLVSSVFLFCFFLALYKIYRLKQRYPQTELNGINFINTTAKGTPFSFFKSIFWNNAIELGSKTGQHIFQHEVAHVKEKHSYDKIFLNIVLVFFWINPFFWLLRKELYMIHEFIADQEALEDSDISAFAEMMLQSVYPGQNFSIVNSFFYSPIKRRLLMLAKTKNPKVSYFSRLLVLPLAAIVFFAFTLKVKNNNNNFYHGKAITVVIDAGHGGDDNGARSSNGLQEKDITLSIAKKIAQLNSNSDINILLSRTDDQTISGKERVVFAKRRGADFFISLHVNSSTDKQLNGFSVLIDKNKNEQNLLLGSAIIDRLKESYKTEGKIETRSNSVLVLDNNVCPAALIECGYLSNPEDAAFISNTANQEKIAKDILGAINAYANSEDNIGTTNNLSNENSSSVSTDSIPHMAYKGKRVKNISVQIKSKNIKVTEPVIKVTYEDGTTEMISKDEADRRGLLPPPPPPGLPSHYFESNALFVINGKISTSKEAQEMKPQNIKSINVLKGKTAIDKYGEKGKNGVIEITTKFDIPENALIIIDGKESSESEFKNIQPRNIESINVLKGESAVKKYGDQAKNGAIEIITKKNVTLSSVKDTIPDKVFIQVEKPASFPGGVQGWSRYISKAITNSISKFTETDYGTCVVRFIVNVDGSVSDVIATTMKGTELAKVAVNAIWNGPKWIPASQNGHKVASYRLQPVTVNKPDTKSASPQNETNKNSSASNNSEKPGDMIFTKLEQPASFPGGQTGWLKYITPAIQKNANDLVADKNSQGSCKVKFIVHKDGTVSDVKAITKQDSKLADVAVNAIENGPRWIPGVQNGRVVSSFVIQPVTFFLDDQNNSRTVVIPQ